MWTVIKFDRKEFEFLKKDFEKFEISVESTLGT